MNKHNTLIQCCLSVLLLFWGQIVLFSQPEIEVTGNNIIIENGDGSPTEIDLTDFGTFILNDPQHTHTFVIRNTDDGDAACPIVNLEVTSSNELFTVSGPAKTVLEPNETTTFTVTFDPSVFGVHFSTITITFSGLPKIRGESGIASSRQGTSPFTFLVKGVVDCASLVDTDWDGVPDCRDACPTDPAKTDPGVCGCNVVDRTGDKDGDGVMDCLDGCPMNPNKTSPGICGCEDDSPDSDGDGVLDCVDQCPWNPNKTEPGFCGCSAPEILDLKLESIGACGDAGTADPSDDAYVAHLVVTYSYPPTKGTLQVRGSIENRFNINRYNYQTTISYPLILRADGKKIDLQVGFLNNSSCWYKLTGPYAPAPCSDGICDVPEGHYAAVDGNKVTLAWQSVSGAISYQYEYRKIVPSSGHHWGNQPSSQPWIKEWTDQTSCEICDLDTDAQYEYRLRAFCGDENKSEYAKGTFSTTSIVTNCQAGSNAGGPCSITEIRVANIRDCDDRGTIFQSDDYFYADIIVRYENAPATGGLMVEGNGYASKVTSQLGSANEHTFTKVRLKEGKGQLALKAYFSDHPDCSYSIDVPMSSNPCYSGSRNAEGAPEQSFIGLDNELHYIKVFPSPAQEQINIEYKFVPRGNQSFRQQDGELFIYDLLGKEMYRQNFDPNQKRLQVDIQDLNSGIYHIILKNDRSVLTQKIIKQSLK